MTDNIEYLTQSEGLKVTIMIGETSDGELFCLIDKDISPEEHATDLSILEDEVKPLRDILRTYKAIGRKK